MPPSRRSRPRGRAGLRRRGDRATRGRGALRLRLRTAGDPGAVELQRAFRGRTDDGPAFRLGIGIGLDSGEAVAIEGGYRGSALNTAARFVAAQEPGQIFASETVVALAQKVEGVRFERRCAVRLKGLEKPVRLVEVVPEVPLRPLPDVGRKKTGSRRRRRLVGVGLVGVAVAASAVAIIVVRSGGTRSLRSLHASAIGAVDSGGVSSEVKERGPAERARVRAPGSFGARARRRGPSRASTRSEAESTRSTWAGHLGVSPRGPVHSG